MHSLLRTSWLPSLQPLSLWRLSLWRLAALGVTAGALTACSSLLPPTALVNPTVQASPTGDGHWTPADQARWSVVRFPGKRQTHFKLVNHEKRAGTQADAAQSISMLRHNLRVAPAQLGTLTFAWQVPELIEGADMGHRHADDSPVRVVLAFEGDRAKFSARDAMLSELSLALNPPTGCSFHPRCPQVTERCKTERPAWRELKGIQIACHEAR